MSVIDAQILAPKAALSGLYREPGDLKHLQKIDPDKVVAFVRALNHCPEKSLKGKKLVAAIGTGGTISMKVESDIRVPDLDFEGVFSRTDPHLKDTFEVLGLDAFKLDSPQMDYSHIHDLAIAMSYVWAHVKVPFLGFLVLHGTDTMAHSAAALSLMMGQGLPFSVVYTGGQKSIQEPMSDAGINFRNALFTLEALHAADMAEVVIVMGEYAMLGTSAVKIDDTLVNAFSAPLHKYVTSFSALEYPVRLAEWLKPRRKTAFLPSIWTGDFSHTLIVHSNLGLNPEVVSRQVSDPDIRAVLLFSYGAGTAYDGVVDAIVEAAKEKGIPVFVISPVNAEYKIAYESAKKMVKKDIIPLYMTLPSALAKIEIGLRLHEGDVSALARFMTESYVGEIPREDSRFNPKLER